MESIERNNAFSAWLATVVILGLALALHVFMLPLMLFSLGGSCVIVFGMPDSPMTQPRSLVGGHFIGAATGVLFGHMFGDGIVVMSSPSQLLLRL